MLVDGPACRLWVEQLGDGLPVTVFAHGLASSSQDLRALTSLIGGTRVLFDFRGHGRSASPDPEAGYDHPAMREDLEAVAAMVGATRALGVSMGAGAILNLLCDTPDRFERVALVMPSRIDDPCPDVDGTLTFADQIETIPLHVIAEQLLALPHLGPLLSRDPRWREHIRAQIQRINIDGVPHALRAYATGRAPVADASRLARVEIPVLIAAHAGDPNHPEGVGKRLSELLAHATLHVWAADFAMMLDDLERFGALADGFLGEGESRGPT